MKLDNIKSAITTGFFVGLIIGIIDITARVIVWSFEWYEFYLTLLYSTIFTMIFFILFGFLIEFIIWIVKLRIKKKDLSIFYFLSGTMFLLLFYSEVYLNRFLLEGFLKENPITIIASLFIFALFASIYILSLTKWKRFTSEFIFNIISFFRKKRSKKFINNFVFIVIIFTAISFLMDLYLLNRIPSFSSDPNLKEYPNIVLITMDTVAAKHLSLYGYHLNTSPYIDKLGENSAVFENAISSSSWTLTSHASLFTGRYPSSTNATNLQHLLNNEEVTLAEMLREKGYVTTGFVGGIFTKARFGMAQGFVDYHDRLDFFEWIGTYDTFSLRKFLEIFVRIHKLVIDQDAERTAQEINQDVFRWLDKNNDQTFFMFINYFDPHEPYTLGKEFREKFKKNNVNEETPLIDPFYHVRYSNISRNYIESVIGNYDAEIFFLDYHIAQLLNKFEELGIRDRTLIIITSDHGEEFYEHGNFGHGLTLYEEVIHVPLIIHYPNEFEGKRIKKRIEVMGVFPTILDVLDIEIPENIDGKSLLPLIEDDGSYNKQFALSELWGRPGIEEFSKQESVSDDNWKLIEIEPGLDTLPSSLFNLKTDKEEQKNLYDRYSEKREKLKEVLS